MTIGCRRNSGAWFDCVLQREEWIGERKEREEGGRREEKEVG